MNVKKSFKIQTKLILLVILAVCLPFVFMMISFYAKQINIAKNDIGQNSIAELKQTTARINTEFSRLSSVSNMFYLDNDLADIVTMYNNKHITFSELDNMIQPVSKKYSASFSNRSFNMMLILQDGSICGDALFIERSKGFSIKEQSWYNMLKGNQTRILWLNDPMFSTLFSPDSKSGLFLVRELHNRENWISLATLVVGITDQHLLNMISGYINTYQNIYLLDQNLDIITSQDNLSIDLDPIFSIHSLTGYDGQYITTINNEEYIISYETIPTSQCKIAIISNFTMLMDSFYSSLKIYLIVSLVFVIIICVLIFFLIRHELAPLKVLSSKMKLVKKGHLDVYAPVTSSDEIGELSIQFNAMIDTTNRLLDQVVQGEESKRRAEIKALQSQINPHFLYNTLASVRYMLYSNDKESADKIILSLIRIMRNALSDSHEFITVQWECELLIEYLNIQKLVFLKPLKTVMNIDENIYNYYTIKLLLQPIIENAILHGLKPSNRAAVLMVSGRSDNDKIIFTVNDNGIGFKDPDKVLNSNFHYKGDGIGLRNVHNRIQLNFGNKYGLNIKSDINNGTTVTVTIPRIEREGESFVYDYFDC